MSNTPLLSLPVAVSVDGTEYAWIVQGGTDKRVTLTNIANTATGFVPTSRSVSAGTGLSGGGSLASDITLSFNPAGLAAASTMVVADSFVINSGSAPEIVTFPLAMQAIGGLTVSPALNLASDKLMVLRAADGLVYYTTPSAIGTAAGNVPAGGTTGQVLSKLSSTNYDTAWTTFTGLSGTLGTTDNMVPRADGTGGQTIQAGNFINDDSGNVYPSTSDGGALGLTTKMWSDLFLADGGVINWNNGNVTATQSSRALTFTGGTGASLYWSALLGDGTGYAVLFNKTRDATNSQRYNFGDVGGLVGDANGAGFWRGFLLGSPAITDPTGGATVYPQTSFFYEYNTLTAPSSRVFAMDLGNTTSTAQANFVLRLAGTDKFGVTTSAVNPGVTGAQALGTTSLMWSDLFLKSTGTINFGNGNLILTHASGLLTNSGAYSGTVVRSHDSGTSDDTLYNGTFQSTRAAANTGQHINLVRVGTTAYSIGYDYNTSNFAIGAGQQTDSNFTGSNLILILGGGNITPGANAGQSLGSGTKAFANLYLSSSGTINWNNGNVAINHDNTGHGLQFQGGNTNAAFWNFSNGALDTARYGAIQITNEFVTGRRQQLAFVQNGTRVVSFGYEGTAATWGLGSGNTTDASWTAGLLAYDFTGSQWKFGSDAVPLASGTQHLGSGSLMWSDLYLKSGGTINFGNGNVTITHSAGVLTQTGNLVVGGTISAGTAGSVVGDVIHYNATSGSITLRPVTGALGSSVLTLPAATDTVAVLAASQAFTNKTYNKVTITAPATSATLTIADGKTLTASNSLTLAGTDSTTMTFPSTSSTVLTTGNTATITKGYAVTPYNAGTFSGTTFTPDPANGNYQYMTITGTPTLAVPGSDCAIDILATNASATGLAISGSYSYSTSNTSQYNATGTNKFLISVRRVNGVSTVSILACQ